MIPEGSNDDLVEFNVAMAYKNKAGALPVIDQETREEGHFKS